jgi:hypothetical protein
MSDLGLPDDAWIVSRRGPRNRVDPSRPYAYFVERERTADGRIENVATVFITNKECPYRCLMCDLWKNTTVDRVPEGAVARQIEWGLQQLVPTSHVKLYNAGSFFDEQAIPRADRPVIAELLAGRRTVTVECHPQLIDRRCIEFSESLQPELHVAMGLETVDPSALPRLNKRMTLEDFEQAARFLLDHGIGVRAFILLRTPFQSETEGAEWAIRSIDSAFSIGVECCSVVPTRTGNGAMESLQAQGHFHPPSLRSMEAVLEYGIRQRRGRVFIDMWDIERFYDCPHCSRQRSERLGTMNLSQTLLPPVACGCRHRAESAYGGQGPPAARVAGTRQ